jgi:hypothetical protein
MEDSGFHPDHSQGKNIKRTKPIVVVKPPVPRKRISSPKAAGRWLTEGLQERVRFRFPPLLQMIPIG